MGRIVEIIIDFDGWEYHEKYAHLLALHFVAANHADFDHAGPILETDHGYVGAYYVSMS